MADAKRQDSVAHNPNPYPNPYPNSVPTINPFHKPNTNTGEKCVYILTLTLTPSISVPLNQLRSEYFPKHLNRTPAHITLFHALPHSLLPTILTDLTTTTTSTRPYHISTGRPFRLRRGVAVRLDAGAEASEQLREELRERWLSGLSEQDRRTWVPHWTVMNEVEDEGRVERVFGTIRRVLCEEEHHGRASGVTLWRYVEGGTWEGVREFPFKGRSSGGVDGKEKEGFFHMKEKSGGGESKSPRATKKAGSKVVGIWKSMTGKRGGAAAEEVKGRHDALIKGRDDVSVEGSNHASVEGRSDASTRGTNDTSVEGRIDASAM